MLLFRRAGVLRAYLGLSHQQFIAPTTNRGRANFSKTTTSLENHSLEYYQKKLESGRSLANESGNEVHEKTGSMKNRVGKPQHGYTRQAVAADGSCGLTAFGITRKQALQYLTDGLTGESSESIIEHLQPAIRGELPTERFRRYLVKHKQLGAEISLEDITLNMDRFANDMVIIQGYINYDVRDKNVGAGFSHSGVLQALAHITGTDLRIWREGEDQALQPNRGADYDYLIYTPGTVDRRLDILLVNGNDFELLEFVGNAQKVADSGEPVYPLDSSWSQKIKEQLSAKAVDLYAEDLFQKEAMRMERWRGFHRSAGRFALQIPIAIYGAFLAFLIDEEIQSRQQRWENLRDFTKIKYEIFSGMVGLMQKYTKIHSTIMYEEYDVSDMGELQECVTEIKKIKVELAKLYNSLYDLQERGSCKTGIINDLLNIEINNEITRELEECTLIQFRLLAAEAISNASMQIVLGKYESVLSAVDQVIVSVNDYWQPKYSLTALLLPLDGELISSLHCLKGIASTKLSNTTDLAGDKKKSLYKIAYASYVMACKVNSENSFAQARLGAWKNALDGDASGAEECFRKAILISPGNPVAYNNLATLLLYNNEKASGKANSLHEARKMIEVAIKLVPSNLIYTITQAEIEIAQGDFPAAAKLLVSVTDNDGKNFNSEKVKSQPEGRDFTCQLIRKVDKEVCGSDKNAENKYICEGLGKLLGDFLCPDSKHIVNHQTDIHGKKPSYDPPAPQT